MEYETYWSILDLPSISIRSYDVFLWTFILATLVWFLIKKFKKANDKLEKLILLWFTGIISVISMSGYLYLKTYDKDVAYNNAIKLLESTKVNKVEGQITNFKTGSIASRRGVSFESFSVDSVDFYYSNELLGNFNHFNNPKKYILKNGLPVRITYGRQYHEILKIEIVKSHYSP